MGVAECRLSSIMGVEIFLLGPVVLCKPVTDAAPES